MSNHDHIEYSSTSLLTITIGGTHRTKTTATTIMEKVHADPSPTATDAKTQAITPGRYPHTYDPKTTDLSKIPQVIRTPTPNQKMVAKLLLQANPNQQLLNPIIKIGAYESIRDSINLGIALGVGAGLTDTLTLIAGFGGAGIGTLAFLIPGVIATSLAAYYLATGLADLRTINPWAANKTRAHITAWLKHNYNITPATFTGKPAHIIRNFNPDGAYTNAGTFTDTTGHHYRLHRLANGKTLLIDEWGKTVKPIGHAPTPAMKTLTATKSDSDPELAPFTRKNRARITASRALIASLRQTADLTTEQTFNLDRDEQILADIVALAAKLDTLPMAERKQGFADLDIALNTVSENLTDLSHGQNRAILKQARILARYTSSLRQTPSQLNLL